MHPITIPTRVANDNYSPRIGASLSERLCLIGLGTGPASFRARCGPEVARLERMPDGALRSLGLRREEALEYVVRRAMGG
jgi:hypothetical protein